MFFHKSGTDSNGRPVCMREDPIRKCFILTFSAFSGLSGEHGYEYYNQASVERDFNQYAVPDTVREVKDITCQVDHQ